MSTKYLLHGLTKDEDSILGAFGNTFANPYAPITLQELVEANHPIEALQEAANSMVKKGYVIQDGEEYNLTRLGIRLWKTRSEEEAEID